MPAAVIALLRARPQLRVAVEEGRLDDLAAGVRAGRLHLALGFQDAAAPRREHAGLRRHELMEEPMVAALPPRHRLARRRVVDLADLADEPWTAPSRDGLVARACRAAGFEPRIAFLAADPLAIRALVASGLAVTLTSQLLAGQLHGVHVAAVRGEPARRALYALLPETGAREIDRAMVERARRRPLRFPRAATGYDAAHETSLHRRDPGRRDRPRGHAGRARGARGGRSRARVRAAS